MPSYLRAFVREHFSSDILEGADSVTEDIVKVILKYECVFTK